MHKINLSPRRYENATYYTTIAILAHFMHHGRTGLTPNTKEKRNMQKQTNIIKPKYHLYLLAAPESGRSSSRMLKRAEPHSATDPQGSITHM